MFDSEGCLVAEYGFWLSGLAVGVDWFDFLGGSMAVSYCHGHVRVGNWTLVSVGVYGVFGDVIANGV